MVLLRARGCRGSGLDKRRRVPKGDASLLSQRVSYACLLLSLGRPALYADPRRSGLELLNLVDQGHLTPALVMGGDLLQPRGEGVSNKPGTRSLTGPDSGGTSPQHAARVIVSRRRQRC
jgi:hypothetical protein